MKLSKFTYATILSIGLSLQTACKEDKIDLHNPNQQTTGTFWRNEEDAMKGISAVYAVLLLDGGYKRFSQSLNDGRADDVRSVSPWPELGNIGKFNLPNTALGPNIAWTTYYQGVWRANQVLENVAKIPDDKISAKAKERVLGQAYFLRGLYFFHLANFFKHIPIITATPKSDADYFVKQTDQATIWNQIYSDFENAKNMLPVSYNDASVLGIDKGQKGRATKGAAIGYLGKAYLFNGRWADAAKEFEILVNGELKGTYSLMPNYYDNFTESFENNAESLFEVQFARGYGDGTDGKGWGGEPAADWNKSTARAVTYGARDFGFTDMLPSPWIYAEYKKETTALGEDDPRLHGTMFYNRPGMTVYGVSYQQKYGATSQEIYVRKYANDLPGVHELTTLNWQSGINERLLRYADVILMYAESLNELGRTTEAYDYIQIVRSRAGLRDLKTVRPGMDQAAMRDQLDHERALEFALEAHRFDDLRRWGWLKDPSKIAILKSRDDEFNAFQSGREYLPIPQEEIEVNPELKQTKGYGGPLE